MMKQKQARRFGPSFFLLRTELWIIMQLVWVPAMSLASTSNFSGTLIGNKPCIFNNNNPIEVDFGDVIIRDVQDQNGTSYSRRVNYTIQCEGAVSTDQVSMTIQGSAAYFDSDQLATNKRELGLQFMKNNQYVTVNEPFTFSYGNQPIIDVTPWGSSKLSDVDEGAFFSTARFTVEYQ